MTGPTAAWPFLGAIGFLLLGLAILAALNDRRNR